MLGDFRCIERSIGFFEQAHAGEDGDDQAAMRKIDVHRPIQWEGLGG